MDFGERYKHALKSRGMSQTELSSSTGLSTTQLSRYRNDKRLPDVTSLAKIARGLNVSTDFLLGLSPVMDYSLDERSKILLRCYQEASEQQRKKLLDFADRQMWKEELES